MFTMMFCSLDYLDYVLVSRIQIFEGCILRIFDWLIAWMTVDFGEDCEEGSCSFDAIPCIQLSGYKDLR